MKSGGHAISEPRATSSAWYTLGLLIAINVILNIDRYVPSIVGEALKKEFSLTDAQFGLLGGAAYATTYALAVLPVGRMVDYVDRRKLLGLMVSIWSLLTMVTAAAGSYRMLIIARMGVGAAETAGGPASLSLISDMFPRNRSATAISLFNCGGTGGILLVFLLGGWLLAHFEWRAVCLIAGAPGLIVGALVVLTVREPRRRAVHRETVTGQTPPLWARLTSPVRRILKVKPLVHAIVASTISNGVMFTVMLFLVSFLVRVHGVSAASAATTVGLGQALAMTVSSILIGPVADRFAKGDPRRLALVCFVGITLAAVAGIVMVMAPTKDMALSAMVAFGLFAGTFYGPGYALTINVTPPDILGFTIALNKLISNLVGQAGIAYLAGVLSDRIGGPMAIRYSLLITVCLFFWAAFHLLMASRDIQPEEGVAPGGEIGRAAAT